MLIYTQEGTRMTMIMRGRELTMQQAMTKSVWMVPADGESVRLILSLVKKVAMTK